ncbi:Exodeoxyribonuclease VII large subunit, partial [hydrothermal vent metagenome]
MPDEKSVDGGKKIFTVSSLTSDIKAVIESGFSGFWVEGEISNFKVYPSGHAYFDLKDDKALLNAVMWKGSRKYLKFEPKQGDHVVCRGRLSVYEKYGKYQLVAESMEPKG